MQTSDILLIVSAVLLFISELLPFLPTPHQGFIHGLVNEGEQIVEFLALRGSEDKETQTK
jgi:hypothetical protein